MKIRDAFKCLYALFWPVCPALIGRVARKLIGKIKVSAVEGDEVSLCKVQSGGKDIKAAIDGGETILVVSLD